MKVESSFATATVQRLRFYSYDKNHATRKLDLEIPLLKIKYFFRVYNK